MTQTTPEIMPETCGMCNVQRTGWEVSRLPLYVGSHFRLKTSKAWVCSLCAKSEASFAPPHKNCSGKKGSRRLQCASDNYSCKNVRKEDRKKPLLTPPAQYDDDIVRKVLQIPEYTNLENSICAKCKQKLYNYKSKMGVTIAASPAPIESLQPPSFDPPSIEPHSEDEPSTPPTANTAPNRCDCAVATFIRERWSDDAFRRGLFLGWEGRRGQKRDISEALGMNTAEERQLYTLPQEETPMKRRKTAMSERKFRGQSLHEFMHEFWLEQAHPCPTQTKLVKRVNGERVEQLKAFVLTPLGEVYKEFVKTHAHDIVPLPGKTSFNQARPFWVKGCSGTRQRLVGF